MNIYLSPEALNKLKDTFLNKWRSNEFSVVEACEAAVLEFLSDIVENPRELSSADRRVVLGYNGRVNTHNVQEQFSACLRLAFTPPTPDVPEKIVEILDEHRGRLAVDSSYSEDAVRELAVKFYEAGMAVSK